MMNKTDYFLILLLLTPLTLAYVPVIHPDRVDYMTHYNIDSMNIPDLDRRISRTCIYEASNKTRDVYGVVGKLSNGTETCFLPHKKNSVEQVYNLQNDPAGVPEFSNLTLLLAVICCGAIIIFNKP